MWPAVVVAVVVIASTGIAVYSLRSTPPPTTPSPTRFEVTASELTPVVGKPFTLNVRVLLPDGSTATAYDGEVTFSSDDPDATLPPDTRFTAADVGTRAFPNVIVRKEGDVSISVNDTAKPALSGSVALTGVQPPSVSYEYSDIFAVPYEDFWDLRAVNYFEYPMNAECFNATSIQDRTCTLFDPNVPDVLAYPYTHWYSPAAPGNLNFNPTIWAPYRMSVAGTNVPGYHRSEPVFLPVLNYSQAPGQRLDFRWDMNYLNYSRGLDAQVDCGFRFAFGNDGYYLESRIVLTMDLQQSKRIFDVQAGSPAEATSWWADNTDPDCLLEEGVETRVNTWFKAMGGFGASYGKYDIANGYEWHYEIQATNVSATVDPATGATTVTIYHVAYGTEVLLARFFYWGNVSYFNNYLDSTKRAGWWGMENAWFEDFHFAGSLGAVDFDFTLGSVMQYTLQHVCGPGPNGLFDRLDDVPIWRWGPYLDDYVDDFQGHPASEIERYAGLDWLHCSPGAPAAAYGKELPYDWTPIAWNPGSGETWVFRFTTGNVRFYDPNLTPAGADPLLGQFVEVSAPMELDRIVPTGFGSWDSQNLTWSVAGPLDTGGPEGSPGPDGIPGTGDDRYARDPWPLIDLRPASSGGSAGYAVRAPASAADPASTPSAVRLWTPGSLAPGPGESVEVPREATKTAGPTRDKGKLDCTVPTWRGRAG